MSFYTAIDCDLDAFGALVDQTLDASTVPHAVAVEKNVPIYDASVVATADRRALLTEWAEVLGQTAGVLVIKGAVPDKGLLDHVSDLFDRIIAEEVARGAGAGDHFAKAGSNARIWNALQKHCLADPDSFARYYAAPAIDAVCEAWLGPKYQMTAQVNLVRPGGAAQTAHRDYHLGFATADQAAAYPVHMHHLSPGLTLQGAVAHCDMPVESGPTKLLPFSQTYGPGYLAYHQDAFRDFFEARYVQMPLEAGDALFFNPATFHGAGDNVTEDVQRLANLLQISSGLGRAMESVDRDAMCRAVYPALLGADDLDAARMAAVIAATAEGYAFPTNLDSDPPVGGLAPKSQADLMRDALEARATVPSFLAELDALAERRAP